MVVPVVGFGYSDQAAWDFLRRQHVYLANCQVNTSEATEHKNASSSAREFCAVGPDGRKVILEHIKVPYLW